MVQARNRPLDNDAFRAVVESAPDAILLVDSRGIVVYANRRTDTLFGYPDGSLLGQRVEVLVPPPAREMHAVHREVFGEEGRARPMGAGLRLSGRRRDGSLVPVEISLSPFTSPTGERYTIALVRDVSEQRRHEEVIRRSEERLRLLTENAHDVIFRIELEPEPGVEFVSAAVTDLTGHTPEDFYARPDLLSSLVHPDDRHILSEAMTPGGPESFTVRLLPRRGTDGDVRWFEFRVHRTVDARGRLLWEGIARDVTEGRIAEEERGRLVAEIETQLERERIAGDLHDDIIQSVYSLGLALHADLGDPDVSKEQALTRAIEGLNSVIADLRTYMQELSGQQSTLERESMRTRIAGLLPATEPPEWLLDIDDAIELDDATQRHIYLLAKELVSNVTRHASAAHASIALRRADGGLSLRVTDDGVGYDPASVSAASYGLRSIEHRVAMLNAAIDIDTAPGRGTRVHVRIPLAGPAEPRANHRAEPAQVRTER